MHGKIGVRRSRPSPRAATPPRSQQGTAAPAEHGSAGDESREPRLHTALRSALGAAPGRTPRRTLGTRTNGLGRPRLLVPGGPARRYLRL